MVGRQCSPNLESIEKGLEAIMAMGSFNGAFTGRKSAQGDGDEDVKEEAEEYIRRSVRYMVSWSEDTSKSWT